MGKFNLELNESERALLMYALGSIYRVPESLTLAQRVASLSPTPAKTSPSAGGSATTMSPTTAPASQSSPEPPARSASKLDSDGELVITPVKIDQPADGKCMVVHYRIRTATGVRLTKMHCWDPAQFGNVLATLNQSTTFLTKTTAKGFVNIVGVKR